MTSPVFSPPILTHRPHRCNNLYANLYVFLSGKVFQEPHMRGLAPGNLSKIHRTSPKSNHWQMEPIRPGHSRPLPIQHSAFGIARCAPPDRPFRGPRSRFCPSPLARPGGPRFVAAARKARPWRVLSRPIGPARPKPGPPLADHRPLTTNQRPSPHAPLPSGAALRRGRASKQSHSRPIRALQPRPGQNRPPRRRTPNKFLSQTPLLWTFVPFHAIFPP